MMNKKGFGGIVQILVIGAIVLSLIALGIILYLFQRRRAFAQG